MKIAEKPRSSNTNHEHEHELADSLFSSLISADSDDLFH